MIDLILVDDDDFMQERVTALVKAAGDMRLIGSYIDLHSALAAKLPSAPNMIILDLMLPDVLGTEAIVELQKKYSDARIVMYTGYENETDVINCMLTGAAGYIVKDTPDQRFLSELRVIAQGGSTLTPRVAQKLLRMLSPNQAEESPLSGREMQVLQLISQGLRYEDIAEELKISVHTVRHHIEKIYKKLNVNSRGQAVAHAVRAGFIKMD